MLQHPIKLSTLLQDYVISICKCGELNVTINVSSCTDSRAVYSIQLTGIMATEGALSLITKVENLTDGLNLTMVVLQLQPNSLESNCTDARDDQAHSHILDVMITLSVIIILLVILLLMLVLLLNFIMCLRYGKTITTLLLC